MNFSANKILGGGSIIALLWGATFIFAGPLTVKQYTVEVLKDHTIVRKAPERNIKRRGVVMKGARLPVYEVSKGPGCPDVWYKVHKSAWICSNKVKVTSKPAWGLRHPYLEKGKKVPWEYGFVREPNIEYTWKEGYLHEVRDILPGFAFGLRKMLVIDGTRFFRTISGNLVPKESIGIAGRISDYSGTSFSNGEPWPAGWVVSKDACVYSEPLAKKRYCVARAKRYQKFHALSIIENGKMEFVRFGDGKFIRKKDVRLTSFSKVPDGVGSNEKWVDVDTKQQIITAYKGQIPVYATMISSGRFGSRTVKGIFKIWAKVAAIAMDNTDEKLEEEIVDAGLVEERHLYSLHDVPWTQFFYESYALHGVYWHDRFGYRKSHGCVNLAPQDAHFFFEWTEPFLPDGWWAIHSIENEDRTIVKVR